MRTFLIASTLFLALFATSCGGSEKTGENSGNPDSTAEKTGAAKAVLSFEQNGLKVYAVMDSPQFPEGTLSLESPPPGVDLPAGKHKFQFKVTGFELGAQTTDAQGKGFANSKDGQHIHFILNNEPYHAHYGDNFEHELKDGHYVMLAFLSRSYHESVKSAKAFVTRQFVVGNPQGGYKEVDLNAPHLFFSRPKGEYFADDTRKLLLDFFLLNCDLSPEGYKVKATINGNEFILTKWAPWAIEGLGFGEVKIKLELIDAEGNPVKSPYNGTERTVKLTEQKPS